MLFRSPSPLLIATGEAIPLRGLEGVPGLPGAPQDEVLALTFLVMDLSSLSGTTVFLSFLKRGNHGFLIDKVDNILRN